MTRDQAKQIGMSILLASEGLVPEGVEVMVLIVDGEGHNALVGTMEPEDAISPLLGQAREIAQGGDVQRDVPLRSA